MAYYPKNKIINNLQTNGEEYQLISDYRSRNTLYYVGFYYKLYNGRFYTGRFPGDGTNVELIYNPYYVVVDELTTAPIVPPSLTKSLAPPLYPTPDDYKNGMFTRYFSKKRNEYLFEELTKDQFDKLNDSKNPMFTLYKPFFIKWMLTGEEQKVADYNFYSIRTAEEKEGVLGLNEFLKMNYLQYYK
jgi:hypothetical protein